jgi:hypothetical protein
VTSFGKKLAKGFLPDTNIALTGCHIAPSFLFLFIGVVDNHMTLCELALPWTLGHVIVHITASAEESAFLAAELARGVHRRTGRSRFEVP